MHEHSYHVESAKISTCVKCSIDAYHNTFFRDTLFCFENLNSRGYNGDTLNVMSPRFPNCFLRFPLVTPHVFLGVFTVTLGVSPVSRQCFPRFLIWILRKVIF